jgi:hypothetical protein
MPRPTFDRADVVEIERFAERLQAKTAYGVVPSSLRLRSCAVPIRTTAPKPQKTGCLGERELRARYSRELGEIQLPCAGVTFPSSSAAKEHIVAVVGHEALHALQRSSFSEDEILRASRLADAASQSPGAYEDYMSCVVELPAHAVMVALALRNETPTDFVAAAQSTDIYAYFAKKLNGAPNATTTLATLVKAASEMHASFAAQGE